MIVQTVDIRLCRAFRLFRRFRTTLLLAFTCAAKSRAMASLHLIDRCRSARPICRNFLGYRIAHDIKFHARRSRRKQQSRCIAMIAELSAGGRAKAISTLVSGDPPAVDVTEASRRDEMNLENWSSMNAISGYMLECKAEERSNGRGQDVSEEH